MIFVLKDIARELHAEVAAIAVEAKGVRFGAAREPAAGAAVSPAL